MISRFGCFVLAVTTLTGTLFVKEQVLGQCPALPGDLLASSYQGTEIRRFSPETGEACLYTDEFLEWRTHDIVVSPGRQYLYATKCSQYSAADAIIRYDLTTGTFVDYFLPPGAHGYQCGMAFHPNGHLLITRGSGSTPSNLVSVGEFDVSTGELVRTIDGIETPWGIAISPSTGNVFVSDYRSGVIREYTLTGGGWIHVKDIPSGTCPEGMAIGDDGYLYVANPEDDAIWKLDPATGAHLRTYSGIDYPNDVSFGTQGQMYVSSYSSNRIYQVDRNSGAATELFGVGSPYCVVEVPRNDCNGNGVPDFRDILECDGSPWCSDVDSNGIPDGCEADPNEGLAGYWAFNEGAGLLANDSSPNENNGTIVDAAWTSGVDGTALHFDCGGYVLIDDPSDFAFANQSVTFSTWVRFDGNPDEYQGVIYLGEPTAGQHDNRNIGIVKSRSGWYDGRMFFQVNGTQLYSTHDGNELVNLGWIHIVGVVDQPDAQLRMYLNGSLDATGIMPAFNLAPASNLLLRVGKGIWEESLLCGDLDEVRIYDRALTPIQVEELYAETAVDCNTNGHPDGFDISSGQSQDCNANRIPDECDIDVGYSADCDTNGVPDECQADFDGDGLIDDCDVDIDDDGVVNIDDVCDYTPTWLRPELIEAEGGVLGDLDGDCDVDLADYMLMAERFTGPAR